MKKSLIPSLYFASAVLLVSCGDDLGSTSSGSGHISAVFGLNEEVNTAHSSRASESGGISVNDLSLKLSLEGGKTQEWSSVAEFPAEQDFKVGNYTMEAYYGALEDEGFEKPYYFGTSSFTVSEGNTTHVNLVAKLSNTMVTVVYTDEFKDYMTAYDATLHSAGGDYVYYASDETRPAYLRPGEVTLTVGVTMPNGTTANLEAAKFTAKAKYHYTVTVGIKEGVGNPVLNITFDENLTNEDVNIDLSDELLNSPAPTLKAVGFNADDSFSTIEGLALSNDLKMNIIANGGLSEVTLTTQSEYLLSKNWPAEKDLMSASTTEQAALKAYGLDQRGLWTNPDKMAVIDFSGVVKKIAYVDGGNNTAKFTVVAKDLLGRVTDPISFTINIQELVLSLSQTGSLVFGGTTAEFDLNYNGASASNDIEIKYLKSSGSWATAEATFTSKGTNLYHVVANISAISSSSVSFKAVCKENTTESATLAIPVETPSLAISASDNDVYATKAYVSVTSDSKYDINPSFQVSTNGSSYSNATASKQSDGTYLISGLTAGTNYYVRATLSNVVYSDATEITTEAATQLPNADMETWYTVAGKTSYWWKEYPGSDENAVWGTNNLMTTSQGGSNTSALSNRNGCAYCASSGTIATTDSHNGTAALIRTQGWGSSNNAVGESGSGLTPTCKYIDAGLLHLGTGRTSRETGNTSQAGSLDQTGYDTGLTFTSRPSSMSFWYKYTAKNSNDHGTALVTVYNGDDIIATGSAELGVKDAYGKVTIDLSYSSGAAKATKIYVRFMSTYSTDFLTLSTSNMNYPSYGNLSDAMYYGSQLYIDDITLNY